MPKQAKAIAIENGCHDNARPKIVAECRAPRRCNTGEHRVILIPPNDEDEHSRITNGQHNARNCAPEEKDRKRGDPVEINCDYPNPKDQCQQQADW